MGCVVMPQEQLPNHPATFLPPPDFPGSIDPKQMNFSNILLFPGNRSSFCYQIVVREAENRQLPHFFLPPQENLWVTDTFEWGPEAGLEVPCPGG